MRRLVGLAGVVLAIGIAAGCGGGGGGGTPAPAKIIVVHAGPTLPGEVMALVLNDSAGRLVSSIAVTSSGADEVTVPHDGSVILAAAFGTTGYSWAMASQPPAGSTIHLPDLIAPTPAPAGFQTWNVSWPPVSLASQYKIFDPCGGTVGVVGGTAGTVSTSSCRDRSSAKILVVAYNSASRPLAWHLTDSIPALPNVTTNLPLTLDQTGVQSCDETTIIPDPSQPLQYFQTVVTLDDPENYAPLLSAQGTPVPGSHDVFMGGSVPEATPVVLTELASRGYSAVVRSRHLPQTPVSASFDTRDFELPSIPAFDAPTRSWLYTAPTFGDGQALFAEMGDQNTLVDFAALLPPGTQGASIPTLPPEFVPAGFDSFAAIGLLTIYDAAPMNGYADFVDYPFLGLNIFGVVPVPFDYVALFATAS